MSKSWVDDLVVGTISHGVNTPTLVLLNVCLGLAIFALALLLTVSLYSAPALVPHAAILLVLALCLCGLINWVIASVGLVDAEEQHKALDAPGGGSEGSGGRCRR